MATIADRATAAFKSAFPGQVITPQDAPGEYAAAVDRPWSQTCWQSPAAFVQLTSAKEVAKALAILRETGVKFAVRTTAHNPNANFNSTDGSGVVLDVHKVDGRTLEKGFVRLGAGNLWGNIYEWLQEKNLSVIGGREKEVGLAGFLVYGGMGAFPSLAGFGADNVKNFELVLADGRIVNANSSTNPDLFVALKGGGSNFGIVTSFDLELHPLIKAQFSISLYNPTDYVNVLAATESYQQSMEQDAKLGLFTNVRSQIIAVGTLYADETDEPPKEFEKFTSLSSFIAPVAPHTKGTLLELGNAMRHADPPAKRTCFTVTTKPSHELYVKAYEHYITIIKDLPAGADFHWTIQPVTESAVQAGEDRGGNILGLQKTPQVWWVFTIEYPLDYDEATAVKAAKGLSEHVATVAKAQGLLLDFLCPTFASAAQNVLRGYGEANVKKLKDVAAKYDPEGLFQKQQVGSFLVRDL